ncbi:hypothetical protein [Microlunatus flavus]|uniref:hypothetical protein n=1 Tax=Microlunatus flavus TaxID=1036181 RepID=UPI0011134813|nr:hypothetical protein [Microlunatus flavus]
MSCFATAQFERSTAPGTPHLTDVDGQPGGFLGHSAATELDEVHVEASPKRELKSLLVVAPHPDRVIPHVFGPTDNPSSPRVLPDFNLREGM